jgi:anti-anti-sigma factor
MSGPGRAEDSPGADLSSVHLLGVPLRLAARSTEHHATLMRELALIDAADEGDTAHARLLALAAELRSKYAPLGEAQRARAEQAAAAGARTIDLQYTVPPDLADDIEHLASLLDEVDAFCRGGELVTLVTPADLNAYRQWVFDEFRAQLRENAPPRPWPGAPQVRDEPVADAPTRSRLVVIEEDLDLEGAARVREGIAYELEHGATDLTLDLARCEFVDSVGISLLLTTLARVPDTGGSLVLVNVSDPIRRTLLHAGILDLLVPD